MDYKQEGSIKHFFVSYKSRPPVGRADRLATGGSGIHDSTPGLGQIERRNNLTERQSLRDELDTLIIQLYGLSRDDFAHILCTFPLVFPDDEAG
jgi:hypothetical protein